MKFLCVECDQPMALEGTRGPDEGSLTVIFSCGSCGKKTAMLTNAMETQMVRSLDVKIGGRSVPAEPMEMVRGNLADQRDDIFPEKEVAENDAEATTDESAGGSKCPFTGAVSEAFAREEAAIRWTAEAQERLNRIPEFVRPMAQKSIEMQAKEKGLDEINAEVMEEIKQALGMKYA